MNALDSMNSSRMPRNIPRQGATMSSLSADDDIEALLAEISQDSPILEEEPLTDEVDIPEDLDSLSASLPQSLGGEAPSHPTHSENMELREDDLEDEDDLVDGDNTSSESESEAKSPGSMKKYLVGALAIIAVIVIIVIIVNANKAGSEGNASQNNTNNGTAQSVSTNNTFYADQLTSTDVQTYQDSMIIEKYIVLEKDACIFVFTGYAENARAFVTAYVDIDTYNRYKTGARVPVLYERVTISGKDYYMKVRLLNES